jgi:Flp pilus assembly protein CpaB
MMLVVVGLLLFIAGGGIAFESVVHGSKNHAAASVTAPPTTSPAVVLSANVPAGTTGQDLVAEGLVSVQPIPIKQYVAADLPSFAGLTDQVLTKSLTKGAAIRTNELAASTSVIQVPTGMDGITITTTGVAGLAGYLQPGASVDLYGNITKPSTVVNGGPEVPAGLAIPCTELVAPNIEVLDVSDVVPPLATQTTTPSSGTTPATTGRTIPQSLTLLLAVTPTQAQEVTFMMQNETLSVAQTQKGNAPPAASVCNGTGQYTAVP